MKKHPITIVLKEDTHKALKKRAEEESRPVAQMARVIIEKELEGEGNESPLKRDKSGKLGIESPGDNGV